MTRAEKRRVARQQEKDKVRYQLTAEEIRQIEKKAVESKKRTDSGQHHKRSKGGMGEKRGNVERER